MADITICDKCGAKVRKHSQETGGVVTHKGYEFNNAVTYDLCHDHWLEFSRKFYAWINEKDNDNG